MKRIFKYVILLLSLATIIISCRNNKLNNNFDVLYNFSDQDTLYLDMDLKNVVTQGIVIPSVNQGDGVFKFRFNAKKGQYYKIYYQNESYKFDETHPLCNENFYGSWEDVNIGFKKVEKTGMVTDSFRIVGNPRNEKKYYGADLTNNSFSKEAVDKVIESINNTPAWLESVKKKAVKNGFTLDKQLFMDAIWMIKDNQNKGDSNNRWKRNPRVGSYSFILVLCSKDGLKTIPDYIQLINKTDEHGNFVNPYSFFAKNKNVDIKVIKSSRILKTRAVITPEYGIFLDELSVKTNDYTFDTDNVNCGTTNDLYSNALFKQFHNSISKQYTLRNIPVVKDVVSDDNPYTRAEYETNKTRFDSTQLQYDYPVVSDCLGRTVKFNEEDNTITLINPGNNDPENLKKESTGIITRVGFTYGKYRGKIKFPVMLNDENIWNGLTYAFWLIYQDNNAWNNRRRSEAGGGYIDKGDDAMENPLRHPEYCYSEIDIEIVKASQYWPKQYYKKSISNEKVEDATKNNNVMFCCTNWDLACPEPPKFASGINYITYKNKKYEAMRWYEYYKALTIKSPISNDVFKNNYYYYEIEWRPDEIIWRIGPSPDKMQVVGYMNDENTCIPNNQMLCIVTQEYHYSEWWPPVVFWQGLIPYNKTDIEGKVYEIVIE